MPRERSRPWSLGAKRPCAAVRSRCPSTRWSRALRRNRKQRPRARPRQQAANARCGRRELTVPPGAEGQKVRNANRVVALAAAVSALVSLPALAQTAATVREIVRVVKTAGGGAGPLQNARI